MTLTVHRRITDVARAEPGRTALVGFDSELAEQTLSWGELAGSVEDAVAGLRAALDPDVPSCVVVEAANTLAAATGIAAALAAEVPVFPLNPATPAAERDVLFGLLGRRYGHVHLMDGGNRPGPAIASATPPTTRGSAAYLLATGASTGVPKISARPGPLRYDPARTP
ncbi:hypothetical protein AB0G02_39085, partial [Actinosynnema sp. NPDC023658]|uniref:hypothetical protein n=1 Tax=Actinosynnema sp. NPDC023658 TaxID=3155465 RepID=UPI0033D452A3